MKKMLTLATASFISLAAMAQAPDVIGDIIPLNSQTNNHDNGGNNPHRAPAYVPLITIDGRTLHFYDDADLGISIYAADAEEGDAPVHSLYVVAGTASAELPASLSGTYIIQVTLGSITYEGELDIE